MNDPKKDADLNFDNTSLDSPSRSCASPERPDMIEVTVYRGLNGTSPSQFRVDEDGVSTFETPPGDKPLQLPIRIGYQGSKVEGTEGELLDEELKAQGGKAVYTPGHGGEGHWSLQFPGKTEAEQKQILSQFAKKKARKV